MAVQINPQIGQMLARAQRFYEKKDGVSGRIGFAHGRKVLLDSIAHDVIRPDRKTKNKLDLKLATVAVYHPFVKKFIREMPATDVRRFKDVTKALELFCNLRDMDLDDSKKTQDYSRLLKEPNFGLLVRLEDFRLYATATAVELEEMRELDPCFFHVTGLNSTDEYKIVARKAENVYAPFADNFGLRGAAGDLFEMSSRILRPELYRGVNDVLCEMKGNIRRTQDFVFGTLNEKITEELRKEGFEFKLVPRHLKHRGKVMKKLLIRNFIDDYELDSIRTAIKKDIHDLVALKLVILKRNGKGVNSEDVIEVGKIVEKVCKRYKGRGKVVDVESEDMVSEPKTNGYRSYHIDLAMGPDYVNSEIIIRDREMDEFAEHGEAAHAIYKGGSDIHKRSLSLYSSFVNALKIGGLNILKKLGEKGRSLRVRITNGDESKRDLIVREGTIVADAIVKAGLDIHHTKPVNCSLFDVVDDRDVIQVVYTSRGIPRTVLNQIVGRAYYPSTNQQAREVVKNNKIR